MAFFTFRQRTATIQALLSVEPEKVSKQMVKWASTLSKESLVLVEGTVQKAPELIKSTTVQDAEIKITKVRWSWLALASADVGPSAEHRFISHAKSLLIYLSCWKMLLDLKKTSKR